MTPEQEKLIYDHIKLPEFVVRNRHGRYYEDALGEARLALVEAAKDFDSRRGVKFKVYANRRIEWAVKDLFRRLDDCSKHQRQKYHETGVIPVHVRFEHRKRIERRTYQVPDMPLDIPSFRKGLAMGDCP